MKKIICTACAFFSACISQSFAHTALPLKEQLTNPQEKGRAYFSAYTDSDLNVENNTPLTFTKSNVHAKGLYLLKQDHATIRFYHSGLYRIIYGIGTDTISGSNGGLLELTLNGSTKVAGGTMLVNATGIPAIQPISLLVKISKNDSLQVVWRGYTGSEENRKLPLVNTTDTTGTNMRTFITIEKVS